MSKLDFPTLQCIWLFRWLQHHFSENYFMILICFIRLAVSKYDHLPSYASTIILTAFTFCSRFHLPTEEDELKFLQSAHPKERSQTARLSSANTIQS